MSIWKDPHNISYDGGAAVTGCQSISLNGGNAPITSRSDDGTLTHAVITGAFTGALAFEDVDQAESVADQTADSADLTFDVDDQADTSGTVTLTGFKSGGVQHNHTNGALSGFSVPFACTAVSVPT